MSSTITKLSGGPVSSLQNFVSKAKVALGGGDNVGAQGGASASPAISALAQALKGRAGDAFSFLNEKGRGKIVSLVDALRGAAKDALLWRVAAESPPDPEAEAAGKKASDLLRQEKDVMNQGLAAFEESKQRREEISRAMASGTLSPEELDALTAEARKADAEAKAAIDAQRPAESSADAYSVAFTATFKATTAAFAALDLGEEDEAARQRPTEKENQAARKLADLGVLLHHKEGGQAMRDYAYSVDFTNGGKSKPVASGSSQPSVTPANISVAFLQSALNSYARGGSL